MEGGDGLPDLPGKTCTATDLVSEASLRESLEAEPVPRRELRSPDLLTGKEQSVRVRPVVESTFQEDGTNRAGVDYAPELPGAEVVPVEPVEPVEAVEPPQPVC